MARTITNHACERITIAQRSHLQMDADATWAVSYQKYTRKYGWETVRRFVNDDIARNFCSRNGMVYPGCGDKDPVVQRKAAIAPVTP